MMKPKTSRGFSAVEVLIAAAIIALALLAIASMFPTAYTNVAQSGKQTAAVSLAQQRVEWLRTQPYTSLVNGNTPESLTGDYAGYTRTTAIADGPTTGVKQVTVTVTTPTGAPVQMTTLIAR